MQLSIKRAKLTATIGLILLMTSVALLAMPVQAQTVTTARPFTNAREGGSIPLPAGVTPDVTVDAVPFLSFRPTTVGVGQTILVNMWIIPPIHAARYFKDFKVTITKPDNTQDTVTLDSYRADSTAWFEYVVDQVGTWKLKFDFPGAYYPTGNYTMYAGAFFSQTSDTIYSFDKSCYYKAGSTAEQTLVVQQDPVMSWPQSPLPTDYWTRPVSPENRAWSSILGDYPWYGPGGGSNWPADTNIYTDSRYRFTPYVQAPNTAHIVWKRLGAISGIMGAGQEQISLQSGGGTPSIIYQGRCYQTVTKVSPTGTGTQSYWQCYNLRTGEMYWERPIYSGESAPSFIEYYSGRGEVPGAASSFAKANYLVAITGGRLIKYDPWTGAVSANNSISPITSATYILNEHALSVQTINATANQYRLINWTIAPTKSGNTDTFSERIVRNITWPWNTVGMLDQSSGYAAQASSITNPATGAYYGTWIRAASLTTGAEVWNITDADTLYSGSCVVADHGKIAVLMDAGYFKAWDLATGRLAWTGEKMAYPWSQPAFGAYSIQSAYGLLYRQAYDGVYAFDWDNGKIAWKYKAPAVAYETPYVDENGNAVYSFNAGANIADGKMYVYNTEHTPTQPITRGWRLHCINATTGAGIWNITGPMTPGPMADGYITASNPYDGCMYVFGKGKSATTVEAPLTAITLGQSVVLKGTVLDMSPGQPGTPCVSKASMSVWMEYLHMQKDISADVKGVPVSLDVLDPNGNYIHIGDVTSDMSGTFSYMWEPEITGKYTVTATFMGDDSYGSSYAETAVGVTAAQATPTPEPQQTIPDNTPLMYAILAAVVIAIIISLLALFRKR